MKHLRIVSLSLFGFSVVAAWTFLAGCGGGQSGASPTAPTESSGPAVVACNAVRYQGATTTVNCSIPGQSAQPSAVAVFFPGRSDCLIATCSAGCVSSVRAGTNTGNSCQ